MAKKITTDPSKRLDIYSRKDMYFSKVLTFVDSVGSPFDFTGYTLQLIVTMFDGDGSEITTFVDGAGLSESLGVITLSKDETEFNLSVGDSYYYRFIVTNDSDEVKTWLNGRFIVHNDDFDGLVETDTITINDSGEDVTITISESGGGGLSSQPDQTLLGNVSGIETIPAPLTKAQIKTMLSFLESSDIDSSFIKTAGTSFITDDVDIEGGNGSTEFHNILFGANGNIFNTFAAQARISFLANVLNGGLIRADNVSTRLEWGSNYIELNNTVGVYVYGSSIVDIKTNGTIELCKVGSDKSFVFDYDNNTIGFSDLGDSYNIYGSDGLEGTNDNGGNLTIKAGDSVNNGNAGSLILQKSTNPGSGNDGRVYYSGGGHDVLDISRYIRPVSTWEGTPSTGLGNIITHTLTADREISGLSGIQRRLEIETTGEFTVDLNASIVNNTDNTIRGYEDRQSSPHIIIEPKPIAGHVITYLNSPSVLLPAPLATGLADGASISWDWQDKINGLETLTATITAITLTIDNIRQGSNHILSIVKNTSSDVTITLAGTGLSFYGYDNADYNTTPNVVLSGSSGNIFDLSFLARTPTSIGVSVLNNGN